MTNTLRTAALVLMLWNPIVHAQDGFTTLFDGKTLKGWNVVGDANWEVVDGTLQATRAGGLLGDTWAAYGDFPVQHSNLGQRTTPTAACSCGPRIPRTSPR